MRRRIRLFWRRLRRTSFAKVQGPHFTLAVPMFASITAQISTFSLRRSMPLPLEVFCFACGFDAFPRPPLCNASLLKTQVRSMPEPGCAAAV